MYLATVIAMMAGLIGARWLGVFYFGREGNPSSWLRFWSGGQAQYGGLIAGIAAFSLFVRFKKLPLLAYADANAPAVVLGFAIGRIGCFLNGDDYGTLSNLPWAVRFPHNTEAFTDHFLQSWVTPDDPLSLSVHPVQLYSALFSLGLFVLLASWRSAKPGLRFALFLMIHGTGRLLEEMFRGDFSPVLGPLSLTQFLSICGVLAGVGIWLVVRHRDYNVPAGLEMPEIAAQTGSLT